jgi:hypothetical protein
MLAAFAWITYLLFDGVDPATRRKMFEGLLEVLATRPDFLLAPIAALLLVWYMRRASRYERLMLDETGIRYQSPLPGPLRRLQPDWSLRWSQVRAARIAFAGFVRDPRFAVLELDTASGKRKILLGRWVAADAACAAAARDLRPWRERFFDVRGRHNAAQTVREMEESPLIRFARHAGFVIGTEALRNSRSDFSLESNRHALVGAVLVIALLCYAVVDLAVSEEIYAVDPPLVLFAVGGAIAVLAGTLWFASAGVPRAETLGLSLLLGGAVGFAQYPGALRVNAATDTQGPHTYDYRLTSYVVFSPLDARLPELSFPRDADYWGQFKLGTVHPFWLRKGGLGFYQVDMAPVHAKMRDYFLKNR